MTKEERIIEILKSCENRIDDSDYHEKVIFPCDYNYIAKEIMALESCNKEKDKQKKLIIESFDRENEQPEKKTIIEIMQKYPYANIDSSLGAIPNYQPHYTQDDVFKMMEEYASQVQPVVSDEEIEKKFPTDLKVICDINKIPLKFNADEGAFIDRIRSDNMDKQRGAKWMRDKLTGK